jgi:hypothetical protein
MKINVNFAGKGTGHGGRKDGVRSFAVSEERLLVGRFQTSRFYFPSNQFE